MSTLKSYIVTIDFKSPYVVNTNHPKYPTKIAFLNFKKGQVINAKIIDGGNLLYKNTVLVPIDFVKEIITKDASFNIEGGKKETYTNSIELDKINNKKVKYLDGAIFGGIIGLVGTYYAEKRGWLNHSEESPMQNKLIGAALGAALGAYAIFRFNK